jgi:transposase-like protein
VEELLGRARYARRDGVDAPRGYRNGLGKPRRLTLSAGTITVRRPRVRGLAERFESRLLPVFKRRTEAVGERQKWAFQTWCAKKGVPAIGHALDQDWNRLVAFYEFSKAHWKHLRTTNPVESPFAAVRLRTAAAKRYKKVENATAVIWKTLLIAERTFRRLDAPELLAEVAEGVRYVNGERVKANLSTAEKKAAA